MSELLSKWLMHYDPIHRGWSPRGVASGLLATNGFFFPRVAGGYNLYRSQPDAAEPGDTIPVGAAGASAREILTFSWLPLAADATYAYALRSIGGGGVESAPSVRSRVVSFDGSGDPTGLQPNSVTALAVRVLAAGSFEVSWGYIPLGEEAPPVGFEVYSDGGSGIINFDTPIGTVSYVPRRSQYRFITGPHMHGAVRRCAVRTVSTEGGFADSPMAVVAIADAEAPLSQPQVFVQTVEADR